MKQIGKYLRCHWVLMISLILLAATTMAEEQVYYSIHVASFKSLENTNAFINSLKNKGKLVFWKKTTLTDQGDYFRVYLGRYATEAEAFEFWKKLKAENAVSYKGIHKFTEIVEAVKIAEPGKAPASGPITKPQPKEPTRTAEPVPYRPGERFVDNGDGTVTDNMMDLMWVKNGWRLEFLSAVNWQEANKRVGKFKLGGHSDWRLPSIDEWRSLIDKSRQYPALIEPNPFENVIVHMPYWSKTEFYYSARYTCKEKCPVRAYTVMLYSGNLNHQNKTENAFIMPVRSLK